MSHREASCFCKAPGMCCCFNPERVEFSEALNVEPENEYPHGKLYGIEVYACHVIRKYTLFNLQRVSIQICILISFFLFLSCYYMVSHKGGSKLLSKSISGVPENDESLNGLYCVVSYLMTPNHTLESFWILTTERSKCKSYTRLVVTDFSGLYLLMYFGIKETNS